MSDYAFFQATKIFKRAVPLMVKYKVPTTPHYFSLWYTYCAGTHQQLNDAVDDTVKRFGSCSPAQCDSLIESYLLDDAKREVDNFRKKLESLVADMGQSIDTTVSDTQAFQTILNSSVNRLEDVESHADISGEGQVVLQDLLKGSRHLLEATTQYQLQVTTQKTEIDSLKSQLQEYEKQATHDALTGTLNRRAFDKQLNVFLLEKSELCLVMVDIDHFKAFNDEFGHQMGDQVLKIVAQRIEKSVEDNGMLYRYGGEEFSVLLPKMSLRGAFQIAEKVRKSLERLSVTDKRSGQKINSITASFGIAERSIGEEGSQFIARADEALYDAKHRGRNRVMPMVR
ncbi:GGDEF domain-containing protein [Enterovibrio calviensis]|uniref:GGDEF domain-containing protein n=1 Tax=Enterovibrio calviensis TaxID=91359 RepID=UPI000482AEBF|nr:GGDEF domain-containing protein [Enterovibrio calviensis]